MESLNKINLVVGFDQREAVAYHVFCQTIIDRATMPVQFLPLAENTLNKYKEVHADGSNKFIYSRFLFVIQSLICTAFGTWMTFLCDQAND